MVMCLVSVVVYPVQSIHHPQYFCTHLCCNHYRSYFFCAGYDQRDYTAGNHDEANWVNNFVITPLTYMGGVFFPMTSLPLADPANRGDESDTDGGEFV